MNIKPIFTYTHIPDDINMYIRDIWAFDDGQIEVYCQKLAKFILDTWETRRHPLMMRNKTEDEIRKVLERYNSSKVRKNIKFNKKIITANKPFTGAIDAWFPEIAEVKIIKGKNAIDIFDNVRNYNHFKKMFIRTVKNNCMNMFSENDRLFPSFVICLRIGSGAQMATNFSPAIARWLYVTYLDTYFPNDTEYIILDPCMGWGGRMLGGLGAVEQLDKAIHYYGTDVNTYTHERFDMIRSYWYKYISKNRDWDGIVNFPEMHLKKWTVPAEDLHLNPEFVILSGTGHLAFTSPPYFNRELYSDDSDQSAIRYANYEEWRDGFLTGLIRNTYSFLKVGGVFMLNIADVSVSKNKKYFSIEKDSISIAETIGFKHIDTLKMSISLNPAFKSNEKISTMNNFMEDIDDFNIPNKFVESNTDVKFGKFEPIFVFIKE